MPLAALVRSLARLAPSGETKSPSFSNNVGLAFSYESKNGEALLLECSEEFNMHVSIVFPRLPLPQS